MDDRKLRILAAVVDEYVTTGEPVGSKAIAALPDINVSSATIRNDMAVLEQLGKQKQPIVFMLWGNSAQTKERLIKGTGHLILKTSHPSPLSVYRGFRGCGHFRACNDFLVKNGIDPIDWTLGFTQKQK